jgi:signal transduction histidine kinase/Fe-S-cluster-containing hydrogenase component 2
MNEDRVAAQQLVTTIGEKCRRCYTCVRECPAKAIRILDGQASVIETRCIGCGNCVTVCSQNAKQVLSGIEDTEALLDASAPVAAIVAPSYPAEFGEVGTGTLVAAIRRLGFAHVHEVAFGADLVAGEYARLLFEDDGRHIATACPAVVSYVRKYHPDLIDRLAPIVSPMLAIARVLHARYGPGLRIVFVGPCIAKKAEAEYEQFEGQIDAVLTYAELRGLLSRRGLDLAAFTGEVDDFDPPQGSLGGLFPVTRGLLQAAGLSEDLLSDDIVSADGRENLADAIIEFESGETEARLLDILCCQGCIMGAGFTTDEPVFKRRSDVSREARTRQETFDQAAWEAAMEQYATIDLSRTFRAYDQRFDDMPTQQELREILAHMNKSGDEDLLDCGACGYETCREHAIAIWQGLAEVEMCLPYSVEELHRAVEELRESNRSLASTKEALVKSEKLASMGQLAAGIAHEVNNPLGILLLHANLLLEDAEEGDGRTAEDLKLIVDQANRCKRIIAGLLNFARQNRVVRQPTDLGALVAEVLRTMPAEEGIAIAVDDMLKDPIAELDADQIVQVLVNLLTNAQQAMPAGGHILVTLLDTDDEVTFMVKDEGHGIPDEHLDKLFSPFFTTKQVGKGTGLGLAVTHGIVKMHRGQITVDSNADPQRGPTQTTFTIVLPRREEGVPVPIGLQEAAIGAPAPADGRSE